ncbi:hypothetical protein E2C01_000625 [Portunus trituberculatus]|uniref:Uncharacterized protein n=1 Tax=Portunus trituberculatus TaxID=210409 RepID=A0A5B7CH28_PORTR|nr:hypothetical protein [Portunus trituberculatus]
MSRSRGALLTSAAHLSPRRRLHAGNWTKKEAVCVELAAGFTPWPWLEAQFIEPFFSLTFYALV